MALKYGDLAILGNREGEWESLPKKGDHYLWGRLDRYAPDNRSMTPDNILKFRSMTPEDSPLIPDNKFSSATHNNRIHTITPQYKH